MKAIYYKDYRYLKVFIESGSIMRVNTDALSESIQWIKKDWNKNNDHQIDDLKVTTDEPYDMVPDYYDSLNQHTLVVIEATGLTNKEVKQLDKQIDRFIDDVTRVSRTFCTVIATDKLHVVANCDEDANLDWKK